MFRRIALTAIVAGVAAGLFAALVQQIDIIPLIERAEIYEAAGPAPHVGFARAAYTGLADLLTGVGFGFVLSGAIALARLRGYAVDAGRGALWGAAGFAAFALAPALGLPPTLPGMEAAALAQRQAWWIGTALATAGGLGLIVFARRLVWRLIGGLALFVPHALGAPAPPPGAGVVPPELAARFAIASIAAAAAFWLLLGALSGWLYSRLDAKAGERIGAAPG